MNKKIILPVTILFLSLLVTACQSDKHNDDSDEINLNDTTPTLADTMIKSDKEKSDSILKYYQDKANQSEEVPAE